MAEVKTLAQRVREIMAENFGVDLARVTDEAVPERDLGADSMDVFEMLMCVEDEFNINIEDDELYAADGPLNVGQFIALVERKVEAKHAPY